MEHIAKELNLDPVVVKKLNYYKQGDVRTTYWHMDASLIYTVKCQNCRLDR